MANEFFLKLGDTYPNIETILSDTNGPVNLTGAIVLFRMSEPDTGNLMIERTATIVTPQSGADIGRVYIEFVDGDSDIEGTYRVEWRVTFGNGKIATFPRGQSANFNLIHVEEVVE